MVPHGSRNYSKALVNSFCVERCSSDHVKVQVMFGEIDQLFEGFYVKVSIFPMRNWFNLKLVEILFCGQGKIFVIVIISVSWDGPGLCRHPLKQYTSLSCSYWT